jgi:hypothetical protein
MRNKKVGGQQSAIGQELDAEILANELHRKIVPRGTFSLA